MLPSFLIPLIGVLVVVLIAFYGFTSTGYFVHFLLLATPVFIALVNRPYALMMLIFALYPSSMIMPGLPAGVQVVHALMFFFIVLTVAHNIIAKPGKRTNEMLHLLLYALLIVLAITIRVRGLGLRSAGSGLIGGAAYVKLILGIGFYLCARYYSLTPAQWKKTVILILIGSFLPMLAQLVFMFSGGTIYQQFMFIQPYVYGLVENLIGSAENTGFVRFHGFAPMALNLLSVTLIFIPFKGFDKVKVLVLAGACLVMGALSGFRSNVLELSSTIFLFFIMSAPAGMKLKYTVGLSAAALAGLVIAIPLMPYLPFPIQRALSWLPFANVSAMALRDATETITWRLEVWKYCLSYWKDFLLVGRGFTVNAIELQSLSVMRDSYLFAYVGHNYHNGPISLLLDLGLPGFIVGGSFLLLAARFSLRALPGKADPFMTRFYNLYRAKLLYSTLAFFTVFGDVRSTFVSICMNLAILESVRMTVLVAHRKREKAKAAVESRNMEPSVPNAIPT